MTLRNRAAGMFKLWWGHTVIKEVIAVGTVAPTTVLHNRPLPLQIFIPSYGSVTGKIWWGLVASRASRYSPLHSGGPENKPT